MTVLLISKVFSQGDSEPEPLLSVSRQATPHTLVSRTDAFRRPEGTKCDHRGRGFATALDTDAEFGGREARKKLEERLLLKLDARMSFLLVIYILNYVSCTRQVGFRRVLRYLLHTD